MADTSAPAAIIAKLIATGIPAPALLATIASTFPNLSPSELSQAIQCATAEAEKRAARKH
jgi:hypothetical protein